MLPLIKHDWRKQQYIFNYLFGKKAKCYLSNYLKKTAITKTREYNPINDFIYPRSYTFVNYSAKENELEKSICRRDKGVSFSCNIYDINKESSFNKGNLFNLMKGTFNQNFPCYMYCLNNKFGISRNNDVSLKMNNYQDGIFKTRWPIKKEHDNKSKDNENISLRNPL